jgi:hypothetical protein
MEKEIPSTMFVGVWLLMKSGIGVYVEEGDQLNAYVDNSVSGGVGYCSAELGIVTSKGSSAHVWNSVYDGKLIRSMPKTIEVAAFDRQRDVTFLLIFL